MRYWSCLIVLISTSLIGLSQDSISLEKRMRTAFYSSDYDICYTIYHNAEEEEYYDMESLDRIMCQIKYLQKDYLGAQNIAQKLYDEDENDFLSDMILLLCLAKNSDNDSIIGEMVEQMLEKNLIPRNTLYNLEIFPKGDFTRINKALERCVNKNELEEDVDLHTFRTMQTFLYFIEGKYTLCYNAGIELVGNDNPSVIYYILGNVRQRRKEFNSAIAFYNIAIKQGFTSYDAYLNRAICLGEEREYVAANLDLDTCLAIDSNYYPLYLKGVNYNFLKDYPTALWYFNKSLDVNDSFADTYNYRGIVYANLKEYSFSVLDFKYALQYNPKTPFAHNNLGISYEKLGRIQEAIKEYETSIRMEPKFFDAYYNLGRIYTNSRQYKKALKYLKQALDLEREVSDIYYLIGLNYAYLNKKSEACKYLHKALEMGHTEVEEKLSTYPCE